VGEILNKRNHACAHTRAHRQITGFFLQGKKKPRQPRGWQGRVLLVHRGFECRDGFVQLGNVCRFVTLRFRVDATLAHDIEC
jgi:hypothetical protein